MSNTAQRDSSGRRRGDHGLTTLEWLLIVAAVAGLAALATVLVTARVQDTAEQISSSDARVAAAIHTAFTVEADAKAATAVDFGLWDDWESRFSERCSLIAVLYADADVEVVHNNFTRASGGTTFDTAAAGYAAAADEQSPNASKAQVHCVVG